MNLFSNELQEQNKRLTDTQYYNNNNLLQNRI